MRVEPSEESPAEEAPTEEAPTQEGLSEETFLSWGRSLVFAGVCTAVVLLVQGLQLRSSIHLLYNGEAMGLSRLMWEAHSGTFEFTSLADLINGYSYLQFDQGTALQNILAAGMAPLLGTNIWTFYVAGLCLGALGAFAFSLVVARLARAPGLLLLVIPFLFLPLPLQTWRLMPWANHTHFLWIPALMALWFLVVDHEDLRWWSLLGLAGIGAIGFVLYRGNVAPALAVAVTLASMGGIRGILRAGLYVVCLAGAAWLILGVWLHLGWEGFVPYAGEALSREPPPLTAIPGRIVEIWWHLLAAVHVTGVVQAMHRVVLAATVLLALASFAAPARPTVLVTRFACTWAVLGTLALAASDYRLPTHAFPLYLAALLCLVGLAAWCPVRPLRAIALAAAVLMGLAGLAEGSSYIDRSVWSQTRANRGLQLYWTLDVMHFELDELPYYHRILDEDRATRSIGLASGTLGLFCPNPISVHAGGTRPDPRADICQAWTTGALCHQISDDRFPTDQPTEDLADVARDIGRGAWIRGNRDIDGVRRSFDGCLTPWGSYAIEGALDEASRWGE